MVTFAFIFQVRSVTAEAVQLQDLVWTEEGLEVHLTRRKGVAASYKRRPLFSRMLSSPSWTTHRSPIYLIRRWASLRPELPLFFQQSTSPPSLAIAMDLSARAVGLTAPPNCYFGSHSPSIGGFNELLCLGFPRLWVMQRLDWTSEQMFSVYFDSRISSSVDAHWFFAHMHPTA